MKKIYYILSLMVLLTSLSKACYNVTPYQTPRTTSGSGCPSTPPCGSSGFQTTIYPVEYYCHFFAGLADYVDCAPSTTGGTAQVYNSVCTQTTASELIPTWVTTCVGEGAGKVCSLILEYIPTLVPVCKTTNAGDPTGGIPMEIENDQGAGGSCACPVM